MTFANNKFYIIGVVLAVVAGAVIYMKVIVPKTAPVVMDTNISRQSSPIIHGVGTLEAKEIVVLAPKTTAKLQELYADEGDSILKGQVLAKMEISELQGNIEESRAGIAKSHSAMASQKAVIEDLKAKKSLADATLNRYSTLLGGGFVTQAEFDAAQASMRSASAQLAAAHENLKQFEHDIEKSKGSLLAQRSKIDDLTLRSPFDGIVISRNAEVGSTVGAGSSVFRLANPKTLWVKVYIDERQSGKLHVGQKATVILRSFPKNSFSGDVVRIGVESDRITEERVVYVRLLDAPDFLHIGEQAEADIHL
ncbi:MAG: HlyD family secretion protein [Sulfuricurvum sp.]